MSYGQDAPSGLQAIKSLTSATYNGQTSPYLIKPGYPQNIFKGDLVAIRNDGFIQNIYDLGVPTYGAAFSLGVFNGCSYITSTATNPIDPASPGRMYWPASTATLNNIPAVADIIDDPNVIFNIQTNGSPGLIQANIGQSAAVIYNATASTGGIVNGNTTTGQSLMSLDQSTIASAVSLNLKILRFVGVPGNVAGLKYNNVEVILERHFFVLRPAGI